MSVNVASYFETDFVNPYRNLAVEEYLTDTAAEGEVIFYLWQNFRTVVIGRNQNAFKECNVERLERDGGSLARRLSGGGSVYHDMGNLNFTFAAREGHYNVDRQLSVILKALEAFGLHGEKTGRNDICIGGKKFSGNAFLSHGGRCCHHGTILVDTDANALVRYLNVSTDKLKAHSVSSAKSRVVNLSELNKSINIIDLKSALLNAFGEIYGVPSIISEQDLDGGKIDALTERFASSEWRFGRNMTADYKTERRFPWGGVEVLLKISGEMIEDAQVFTDALEDGFIAGTVERLKGKRFNPDGIEAEIFGGLG